jgi:hypothetical protein
MTVFADQGAPLGVSTRRAFSSAAAARADMPASECSTGAIAPPTRQETSLIIPGDDKVDEIRVTLVHPISMPDDEPRIIH